MTEDGASCYKCGSTHIESISVQKVGHKGTHIRCLDCKAEKFYPTKE